jgi:hypothetical protein
MAGSDMVKPGFTLSEFKPDSAEYETDGHIRSNGIIFSNTKNPPQERVLRN